MTREEAIELKAAVGRLMYSNNKDVRDYNALIDFIESALRPVSREQVERVWKGCINCHDKEKLAKHIHCWPSYCPVCGKPLTKEAVQMVMERLEALKDAKR